jgi:hypothetical protein
MNQDQYPRTPYYDQELVRIANRSSNALILGMVAISLAIVAFCGGFFFPCIGPLIFLSPILGVISIVMAVPILKEQHPQISLHRNKAWTAIGLSAAAIIATLLAIVFLILGLSLFSIPFAIEMFNR